jgi:hypothetical protein
MSPGASKLRRAIEELPDLSGWMQRIAAPCGAMQRFAARRNVPPSKMQNEPNHRPGSRGIFGRSVA